jgi:hypothetical protein
MKSLVGKFGTLALVAMAGIAVTACSSTLDKSSPSGSSAQGENIGTVGMKLQPVAGITITQVHYTVTAGNPASTPAPAIVSEGNLPTPGLSDNFSFGIPLPVGTGYYVSISGESAQTGDDITCTGSYGPFAVTPNSSTPFNMTLLCVDNTKGQILSTVTVDTNACPRLIVDYAVAEPGSALKGSDIDVHSSARDLDNATAAITYAWAVKNPANAAVGSFVAPTAANTKFHCANAGDSVILTVTASNGQCSKTLETVVSCVNASCGNGVLDADETCDTALDPTCPTDCTRVCGDGIIESGEGCDPLPANLANAQVCIPAGSPNACTVRPVSCGDGFVNGAEACDPVGNIGVGGVALPAGSTCNPDCTVQGPAPVVCGNGAVTGTEECDAGTGTTSSPVEVTSRTCSAKCESWSTTACVECEQAGDCFASSDNCLGPQGSFTIAQQKLCTDVSQCIQDSNCLDGAGSTLGKCYCGTLSTAACSAAPFDLTAPGAPNGPCAAIMQAGATGVTSNTQMLAAFTNKSRPTGAAGQRLNCDKTDPVCAPICGVE